jgi:hypothetical protein
MGDGFMVAAGELATPATVTEAHELWLAMERRRADLPEYDGGDGYARYMPEQDRRAQVMIDIPSASAMEAAMKMHAALLCLEEGGTGGTIASQDTPAAPWEMRLLYSARHDLMTMEEATLASSQSTADEVNALWREMMESVVARDAAYDAAAAAAETLPWWAKPGPACLGPEGYFGPISYWPADPLITPPEPIAAGIHKRVRRSLHEVRDYYNQWRGVFGKSRIPAERANMRRKVRRVIELLRARRRLEAEAGVTRLRQEAAAHDLRWNAAVDRITSWPDEDNCPTLAAARLLLVLIYCVADDAAGSNDTTMEARLQIAMLRALRGRAVGLIGEHVDEVLTSEKPFCEMAFWRAGA